MNRDKIHNLKSELSVDKPQFDASLGGKEMPNSHGMSYKSFVECRITEIAALSQAIEEPTHTSLIFQELPKHMRRRVMGHTTKRLPRLLREAHHNQLMKGSLIPSKKPNRKHKRKTRSLLEEFNRRQKEFVWLETHMWHAKRFHMIDKWGYKVANYPNDKSYRACYRATSKHCLLQDVSYLCCIELEGPSNLLLDGLRYHTQTECGLTFAARVFLNGAREGNVTFFQREMYPFGAIGNVNFLWRPLEGGTKRDISKNVRSLWIWVHPASFKEVTEELINTFKLKLKDNQESIPVGLQPNEKRGKNVERTKLETRNVPYIQTPKYESNKGIRMVLLKDTLTRFRLTGPLSQAVLKEALCVPRNRSKRSKTTVSENEIKEAPVEISKLTPASDIDDIFALMSKPAVQPASVSKVLAGDSSDEDMQTDQLKEHNWWTNFYKSNPYFKSLLKTKRDFWQSVTEKQSPAELPPNLVVGLTIVDPRLRMPLKREKAVPDDEFLGDQPAVLTPKPEASACAIWHSSVRDVVTQTKLCVSELNARRSKNLVPGFTEEEEEEVSTSSDHSRIPILLLQRPGCQQPQANRIGLGSGWDVVAPAGWGMPLWMALVFRGARAGGLREAAGLRREMTEVDVIAQDSLPGRRESDLRREELTKQHFRLPPAKRPNFIKLGVSSPFSCPWDILTKEWAHDEIDSKVADKQCCLESERSAYYILRDKKTLLNLKHAVEPSKCRQSPAANIDVPQECRHCLIPVSLSMCLRGVPDDFSLVCIPTRDDLERLAKNSKYLGPEEPQHADYNAEQRKTLRGAHKTTLKRLRRTRIRLKKKVQNLGVNLESVPGLTKKDLKKQLHLPLSKEVVDSYNAKERDLWLPKCSAVKNVCSRQTIGFVAQGGFSFAKAGGTGVGYVPFPALVDLLTKQTRDGSNGTLYVLVRNTTSYQYHFATLHVICPV